MLDAFFIGPGTVSMIGGLWIMHLTVCDAWIPCHIDLVLFRLMQLRSVVGVVGPSVGENSNWKSVLLLSAVVNTKMGQKKINTKSTLFFYPILSSLSIRYQCPQQRHPTLFLGLKNLSILIVNSQCVDVAIEGMDIWYMAHIIWALTVILKPIWYIVYKRCLLFSKS